MLYSKMLIPTLREEPKDAEIDSHKLMLRAGMVRKSAAGLYSFLPLGFRTLLKVTGIIREEMNNAGAQELLPPFVTPADLWKESGRFDIMGKEMLRFKDRHDNEMVLGPTHEEAFTNIVRENVHSYRDLPLNLYQINTKFRDEIRPRYGIMRCREFIMKDAYSFDADEAGLDANYQAMRAAYRNIFRRCGLSVDPVLADSGAMGGSGSEEFMVPSRVGEELIVKCHSCGYVANTERAAAYREYPASSEALEPMSEVSTPSVRTIEELTAFFSTTPRKFIKTLIYIADGAPLVALIRGDMDVNEVKLKNVAGAVEIELASEDKVYEVTGAPVGFAGPAGMKKVRIIADASVPAMVNAITGANKKDLHLKNVNPGRDFQWEKAADIQSIREGDLCPECRKPLNAYHGIEVGHIFKLGYKYTDSMNVVFLDKEGKEQKPIMGCYGIGVGRTIASVIEQSHDDHGIIWPMSIAPFHILIVPVNISDENQMEASRKLYDTLKKKYEVLMDDRDERAGVKFNDADLIGIPIRITVGKTFAAEGKFELKLRAEKDKEVLSESELISRIGVIYDQELAKYRGD
ncbi:MAG: proline--tRNA ligase [Brevinematales bacterium]|nr:proline--tRNA ligase [Brevinematales bacterium]